MHFKNAPKIQKSVKKAGFQSSGATIRTRRESQCLGYAGFLDALASLDLLVAHLRTDWKLTVPQIPHIPHI